MLQHMKGIAVLVAFIALIGVGSTLFLTQPSQEPNPIATDNSQTVRQANQEQIKLDPVRDGIENTAEPPTQDTARVLTPPSQKKGVAEAPQVPAPEQKNQAVPEQQAKNALIRFKLDSGNTQASFTIDEVLRGSPFTVVGTTRDVSGDVSVDIAHPLQSTVGTITIDARTLHTDSQNRDGAIKRFILHSEDVGKEYITFTPKTITGLPKAFAAGIPLTLTLTGDLTIAGVTHLATFAASNVLISPDALAATARASVKRSDYGLVIPNIPFVANVSDDFTLSIQITASAVH